MRKLSNSLILAGLMVVLVLFACNRSASVPTDEEIDEIRHNAWCDKIYHQNPSCPLHGKVEVPIEVQVRQRAALIKWCNEFGHRNPACPGYVIGPIAETAGD